MPAGKTKRATDVVTIDLRFMQIPGVIASYLCPHARGAILIECGPGSTSDVLQSELDVLGYELEDISDVFLTHIHLDHAGAAGWLARHGARIHVHPVGAPHMLDPAKLLSSAERIYGDMMDVLWGEFLPVPKEQLSILEDNQVVQIEDLSIQALDTPGHARHHYAYLFDDICFSGDIGGIRLAGCQHLVLPMPPPEFQLEDWRLSAGRLQAAYNRGLFQRIAPTHFGISNEAGWHLNEMERILDQIEGWIDEVMPGEPSIEQLSQRFIQWTNERYQKNGFDDGMIEAYEAANPAWMSPYGIQRYWRKYRQPHNE